VSAPLSVRSRVFLSRSGWILFFFPLRVARRFGFHSHIEKHPPLPAQESRRAPRARKINTQRNKKIKKSHTRIRPASGEAPTATAAATVTSDLQRLGSAFAREIEWWKERAHETRRVAKSRGRPEKTERRGETRNQQEGRARD